jgi:hypothetical protein
VQADAEGWDPVAWRKVASTIAALTAWSAPNVPVPGDPPAYAGSPAQG